MRQSVDAEPAFFGVNHRDGSELEIPNKKNMFISICSRWLESEYWCFCRLKFEIYIRIYIYIPGPSIDTQISVTFFLCS